jgi:formylglycine-generating enzyme required for sulfatase activity
MPVNMLDAVLGAVAAFAVPVAALGVHSLPAREAGFPAAETVEISATVIDFPEPGEFLRDGHPVAAPVRSMAVPSFRIMKRQVGLADYERCVAAGACDPAASTASAADVPVTGVSWFDAQAYSRWYSETTGEDWRLPTALEAAVAAGERFVGESVSPVADDPANPAVRWIRRYREEAAAKRPPDPEPKPRGHYGANTKGIDDFGGNVWEWTSTCYERVSVDSEGAVVGSIENCGVHVLEGRHRAYMSNFVRDGKSGGCAVGTPPENLGFRLIKDETPLLSFRRVQKLLAAIPFLQDHAG